MNFHYHNSISWAGTVCKLNNFPFTACIRTLKSKMAVVIMCAKRRPFIEGCWPISAVLV